MTTFGRKATICVGGFRKIHRSLISQKKTLQSNPEIPINAFTLALYSDSAYSANARVTQKSSVNKPDKMPPDHSSSGVLRFQADIAEQH